MNMDRILNAIGVLLVGVTVIAFGMSAFTGPDSYLTQMVSGSGGYAVEYDLNNGSGDFNNHVVDFEENEFTIPDKEPQLSSYIFKGWRNSADEEVYFPGTTIIVNENIVLKAQWEASTHDVRFDLNGGHGNIPGEKVKFNETYHLPETLPTLDGKTLSGWESNVDNELYQPGEEVSITRATRFTAIWVTSTYDVEYDVNGGEHIAEYDTVQMLHGEHHVISKKTPVRVGHTFKGWKHSLTDDVYKVGSSFLVEEPVKLTAIWEHTNHRVEYNLNGGKYGSDENPELAQYKLYGEIHQSLSDEPYRMGYIFNGWRNSHDGALYDAGSPITIYDDTILKADWSIATYRIKYDLAGGSGNYSTDAQKFYTTYTLQSGKPSRYGYIFQGWKNSKDHEIYHGGDRFTLYEETTLTAQWETDVFEITFDLNGGWGEFPPVQDHYRNGLYLGIRRPVMTGSTFRGWTSSRDNKTYLPGEVMEITGDTVMTAVWSTDNFDIEYDENGAQTTVPTDTMPFGSNYMIVQTPPLYFGYSLDGWENNYDGKLYQPGDLIPIATDIQLKAQWSPSIYNITYDLNGGSGPHTSDQSTHGFEYEVDRREPVRQGYEFVGWRDVLGNMIYVGGMKIDMSRDLNLVAEWQLESLGVTYNLLGGVGSSELNKGHPTNYGYNHKVVSSIPRRTGYEFQGWRSDQDSRTYRAGDQVTVRQPTMLSAIWERGKYTLSYNLNGGSGSGFYTRSEDHGRTFYLPSHEPTLPGSPELSFKGWLDSATEIVYQAGDFYTMRESTTLIAQWGYSSHLITYEIGEGEGSASKFGEPSIEYNNPDASILEDHELNMFLMESSRQYRAQHEPNLPDFHTFEGWKSDVDGKVYGANEWFTPVHDMTLTGQYLLYRYPLTYSLNGGSGYFPSDKLVHSRPKTITGIPTRYGHDFRGWTRSDTGSRIGEYDGYHTFSYPTGPVHLTANWRLKRYDVYVDGSHQIVIHGNSAYLPNRSDSYGYYFNGWSSSAGGSYSGGSYATIYESQSFSERWSPKSFPITIDGSTSYRSYGSSYYLGSRSRPGYIFKGWTSGPSGTTGYRTVSGPATHNPIWEAEPEPEPEEETKP